MILQLITTTILVILVAIKFYNLGYNDGLEDFEEEVFDYDNNGKDES